MNSFYNQGERVEISRSPSDALFVIDSADRSSSSSSTGQPLAVPNTQPYNNFRLQKPQNMVQGGFTRLQLTEVNFPYAIPNVNSYTYSFWVQCINPTGGATITQQVAIGDGTDTGYFSGQELAGTVKLIMNGVTCAAINSAIGVAWDVEYKPESSSYVSQSGGFVISAVVSAGPTPFAFKVFPCDPRTLPAPTGTGTSSIPSKSLLTIMGFNPLSNWGYLSSLTTSKQSLYAPLSYTSYIDVVSSKLTYYQNVQDSSSKTTSFGSIICRIYVANETSDAGSQGFWYNGAVDAAFNPVRYVATLPPGSTPFLIHRQFVCPKSFKWDGNQAIDWLDIKLYDDAGQPLFYDPNYAFPDFQITFKCTED